MEHRWVAIMSALSSIRCKKLAQLGDKEPSQVTCVIPAVLKVCALAVQAC